MNFLMIIIYILLPITLVIPIRMFYYLPLKYVTRETGKSTVYSFIGTAVIILNTIIILSFINIFFTYDSRYTADPGIFTESLFIISMILSIVTVIAGFVTIFYEIKMLREKNILHQPKTFEISSIIFSIISILIHVLAWVFFIMLFQALAGG